MHCPRCNARVVGLAECADMIVRVCECTPISPPTEPRTPLTSSYSRRTISHNPQTTQGSRYVLERSASCVHHH